MPFQKVNLDPSASGSSGLARGLYRTTADTLAECAAAGYFDEAWALLRGVKAMLVIASDGDAEFRLDVIPSQVTLTKLFASSASGDLAETALQPEDVGTAAAEDVEFFANAGQGAKADTAVQPDGLNVFPLAPMTHLLGHDSDGNIGRAQVLTANAGDYGAVGSFYIDPLTRAIYDKCATKPTHMHLRLIDDVIVMLRDWALLDGDKLTLFKLPIHNEADDLSLSNWLDTADAAVTKSGTLTFVPGKHWVGSGSAAYLQFAQTPADVFLQDAASFMIWLDGANDGNSIAFTSSAGVLNLSLLPRAASNGLTYIRFNSTTALNYTTTLWGETSALAGRNGTFGFTRADANNVISYRQGYKHSTGVAVSSAPHSSPLRVNWQSATGTPDKFRGLCAAKAALSEAEMRAVHRIMNYYLMRAPAAIASGVACPAEDIDDVPIDDFQPIQDAVNAGIHVTIREPEQPWKTYWLGQEVKVPSHRRINARTSRIKVMASAPNGHCCFTNSDRINGNVSIDFTGGWLDWNKGNRANLGYDDDPDWEGRSCLGFCRVDDLNIRGVTARGAWLHCINASSTDEEYLGNTDYKDGTGATADQSTKQITIEGCRTFDHGDDGITTHGAHKVTVRGNYCWGGMGSISGGSSGIEVDEWSRKAIVTGNYVWDMLTYSELTAGGGSTAIIVKGHENTPSADSAIVSGNFINNCFEGIGFHNNTTVRCIKDAIASANVIEDMISCGIRTYSGFDITVNDNHLKKTCRDVQEGGAIRMTNDAMSRKAQGNTITNTGQANFAIYTGFDTTAPVAENLQNNIIRDAYQAFRMASPNMIVTGNNCVAGTTTRGTPAKGVAPTAAAVNSILSLNRFIGFTDGIDLTLAPVSLVQANNIEVNA